MNDLISRQAAIEAQERIMSDHPLDGYEDERLLINALKALPSAQPEPKNKLISEIEGKTPEETYDFLVWLLNDYGMQFTDSRQAVIEWLRGE